MSEVEARFVEAIADQAALAIHATQLFERLEALATHDELTGLANRRLLLRRLDRAMGWADRYSHDLSVLALDLDHFKQLNDREGHAAGDAALVSVAEVLRALARSVDTVARTGGEELIVLLPETDARGAEAMAERLRRGIANVSFPGSDAQPAGHLSVSIGVAVRRSGEPADALIRRADTALYQAKERGRNCVVMAEPTL